MVVKKADGQRSAAMNACTEGDLERAGDHLAEAVTTIGIDAAAAFLTRGEVRGAATDGHTDGHQRATSHVVFLHRTTIRKLTSVARRATRQRRAALDLGSKDRIPRRRLMLIAMSL